MNFLFRSLVFMTITSFLFSCTQSSKVDPELSKQEKAFDSIMTQVIAVHDEVMPKMGEMNTLIKTLALKVDTTAQGIPYRKAQEDLKSAHDEMMSWMGEFSDAFPPSDVPESNLDSLQLKMQRLHAEKTKILAISKHMHTSIANANAVLSTAKDSVQ